MRFPWQTKPTDERKLIQAAEALVPFLERGDDEQVAQLMSVGFEESEAHRLVAFLPMAFSRPVLEGLGVQHFSSTVSAWKADGTEVKVKLAHQPEFIGALRLARSHQRKGVMDHRVYRLIAESSAEIDAVSKALNAEDDLRGAAIATVLNGAKIADHLVR